MGGVNDKLLAYLDARLATVDRAPGTWGSPESLELQTLLLLEVRSFLAPPSKLKSVRLIYVGWIRTQLPSATSEPLWVQLGRLGRLGRAPELPQMLGAFRDYLRELYESHAR